MKRSGGFVNTKASTLNLRKAEFNELIKDLAEVLANEARSIFLVQINQKNIKLTGALERQFNDFSLEMASDYVSQAEFEFNKYGRFKDMRYVEYRSQWVETNNLGKKYKTQGEYPDSGLPNSVAAMMEFIEEKGLHNFRYIPGYENKPRPSNSVAVKRLAWTLAASRLKKDVVRNKKNRDWYTKGMMLIRQKVTPQITESVLNFIANGTYSELWESDVS